MRTTVFVAAALLAGALGISSCECEPDQCPAFSEQGSGYTFPAEFDSLSFINAAGERIVFGVVDVTRKGAHESGTMYNPLGPCEPRECSATGDFDARSAESRDGSSQLTATFLAGGGNNGTAVRYHRQSVYLLGFDFSLPAPGEPVDAGSILLNRQLGAHVYDTLFVQQRDTLGAPPDSLAVWRVYIHRPEGVVGFEDRQTGSLFYRE